MDLDEPRMQELAAAHTLSLIHIFIFWGLLVLLSLVSFDQNDPSINHAVSNPAVVKNLSLIHIFYPCSPVGWSEGFSFHRFPFGNVIS